MKILRIILYFFFMFVSPILIIAGRFDLMGKSKLSIFGYICVFIVVVALIKGTSYFLEYMNNAVLSKYVKGVVFLIIPLIVVFFLTGTIANNLWAIRSLLIRIGISFALGIIVNPFPKMIEDKKNANK